MTWRVPKYVLHDSMMKNDQTSWRKQQHRPTCIPHNLYIKSFAEMLQVSRYHQYGKREREIFATEMDPANHIRKSFTWNFSLLDSKCQKCGGRTHSLPCKTHILNLANNARHEAAVHME